MGLTRAEQETIIRWDADEQVVNLYSAHPATWRRIERVLRLKPYRSDESGREYRIPLSEFRWGRKRQSTLSEAERASVALRMTTARQFLAEKPQ